MTTQVLACIDASPYAQAVCDYAVWAAKQLSTPVTLVHVLDKALHTQTPDLSGSIGLGSQELLLQQLAELDEKHSKLALQRGRAILDAAKAHAEAAGVTQVDERLRHGQLVDALQEMQRETRLLVLGKRGFSSADFAKLHPGGSLGKRLYLMVGDIYSQNQAPSVSENASLKEIIIEISSKRLGATAVVKEDSNELVGIITDGDLRRMLNKYESTEGIIATDIMTVSPLTIEPDQYAAEAMAIMQEKNITQLIVTKSGKFEGFVHLHDLLKEGLV